MSNINFLSGKAEEVARQLIGWELFVLNDRNKLVGGTIIETEAYSQEDAASHSFRGKTPRNEIMFGVAGRAYVYFTYGMHWCMNIVTGREGEGDAVLIRSILPEIGVDIIRERRGDKPDSQLTNGPAKLCQALGITGADNGLVINDSKIILEQPNTSHKMKVVATERIGIRNDTHRLWRFVATTDEKYK